MDLHNGCTSEFTLALVNKLAPYHIIHTSYMSCNPHTGIESYSVYFDHDNTEWHIEFEDTQKAIGSIYVEGEYIKDITEDTFVAFLNDNRTILDY